MYMSKMRGAIDPMTLGFIIALIGTFSVLGSESDKSQAAPATVERPAQPSTTEG